MNAISDKECIEILVQGIRRRGLSDFTLKDYPLVAGVFARWCAENSITIATATQDDLEKYLDHLISKNIKRVTQRHYFAVLSTLYDMLLFKRVVSTNPVIPVTRQYLRKGKHQHDVMQHRQCLTDDQMRDLIQATTSTRDKCIILVLAKTGLRRSELAALDVGDINLEHRTIRLHPTGKRTSEIAFFDEETSRMIQKWLARREKILKVKKTGEKALFLNKSGRRLAPESISGRVQHWATVAGLHDPDSKRLEDRYMAHCTRHWFSTRLDENGCPNTILKELRGDNRQSLGSEQGYIHVNRKKIQEWYEKCIPQLGI